jgi:hypothetical protein
MTRRDQPHDDSRDIALQHFNSVFRHRYRLPGLTAEWVADGEGVDDLWAEIPQIREGGVRDASCAVLARIALSITPRYAIGLLDGSGVAHVLEPKVGAEDAYRSRHLLMVNPLGGIDNWEDVARWVRRFAGEQARRMDLAGLASEERPDFDAIDRMLRSEQRPRATVLPPDEAFSAALAAEVSFIYDVPVETLRAWKQTYRRGLAARRPGRPRKPLRNAAGR